MGPVSAGRWAEVVGPLGSAPRAARRRKEHEIEFAALNTCKVIVLGRLVQEVMAASAHHNVVEFFDHQSDAARRAELREAMGDTPLSLHS